MKIRLPDIRNMAPIVEADPEHLIFTSKRYYSNFYGPAYIKRLSMVLKFMGNTQYENLLDLGFGSGIFLPELYSHTKKLVAVDRHRYIPLVRGMLKEEKVFSELARSDILALPFKKESFDCIVCLSMLEFVDDVDRAISEIWRIAKFNSTIIIGAPVLNKITDICYDKFVKSKYHRQLHKSNHIKIIDCIEKYLKIEKIDAYPLFIPVNFSLFFVLKATKLKVKK